MKTKKYMKIIIKIKTAFNKLLICRNNILPNTILKKSRIDSRKS